MARTEAATYRKTQRMIEQTHAVPHGRSLLEMIEQQLDNAMHRHLDAKAAGDTDTARATRGEVRGLARAVGIVTSPYYPIRGLKQAETDSASRVRRARAGKQQDEEQGQEHEADGSGS